MSASLSGKVAVYGMDGTVAFTGMVKTANILKGFSLTESGREARLEKNGHIIGGAKDIVTRSISITIIPYSADTTPTLAEAKALVVLPPDLGDIVIDDFGITIFNGTWTSVGSPTATPREDGYLEITLTGEQYKQSSGSFLPMSSIASA